MTVCLQFPELLQRFFTDRLMQQQQASPHTIASYRDTFRLLVGFAHQQLRKEPAMLAIEDLDVPFVGAFLNHLERDRGIGARSRNVRLAAIHSFFRYVALNEPKHAALTQCVLALPSKRFDRRHIEFLTRPEIDALLAAPDQTTWGGRRDYTLLLTAVQTGLRVSELIGLRCEDVVLQSGTHVRCRGKGRKERCTPLRKEAVAALRVWLRERATARQNCPTLRRKRVSAHVLRHSFAMDLLQHGVDRAVIALWLGHESVETTQIYLHADMTMKERALAKTASTNGRLVRYRPPDHLLAFLESL